MRVGQSQLYRHASRAIDREDAIAGTLVDLNAVDTQRTIIILHHIAVFCTAFIEDHTGAIVHDRTSASIRNVTAFGTRRQHKGLTPFVHRVIDHRCANQGDVAACWHDIHAVGGVIDPRQSVEVLHGRTEILGTVQCRSTCSCFRICGAIGQLQHQTHAGHRRHPEDCIRRALIHRGVIDDQGTVIIKPGTWTIGFGRIGIVVTVKVKTRTSAIVHNRRSGHPALAGGHFGHQLQGFLTLQHGQPHIVDHRQPDLEDSCLAWCRVTITRHSHKAAIEARLVHRPGGAVPVLQRWAHVGRLCPRQHQLGIVVVHRRGLTQRQLDRLAFHHIGHRPHDVRRRLVDIGTSHCRMVVVSGGVGVVQAVVTKNRTRAIVLDSGCAFG